MLSPEVLRLVVAKVDQPTRVACCVACKKLRDALMHPTTWHCTTVYALDAGAADFLSRVKPDWLHVRSTDVARLDWFLDGLLCGGVHATLRTLVITVGVAGRFPSTCTLAGTLGEFPELTTLIIEVSGLREPACLAFLPESPGLRKLHSLYVVDKTERQLEVYLKDAHFPALEKVVMRVATSDVLAHCRRFPGLRDVAYESRTETYEDADFGCTRLTSVRVDVRDERALCYLLSAMARGKPVQRLIMRFHGDMSMDDHVNARNVHVHLLPGVRRLELEYGAVSDMWSLEVGGSNSDAFKVVFRGMGSWDTFTRWSRLTSLVIGGGGTVVVEPC